MNIYRTAIFSLFILLAFTLLTAAFPVALSAQDLPAATPTPDEKQKAKDEKDKKAVEVLERAIGEVSALRLPENRTFIYTIAGDLLWRFDEKRARAVFRSAAEEIMSGQFQADKEAQESDLQNPNAQFYEGGRSRMLLTLAKYDADMAQEIMMQTRTQRVSDALVKYRIKQSALPTMSTMPAQPGSVQTLTGLGDGSDTGLALMEIQIEQTISLFSADQNPDKAIKLIRESLAKGISYQAWTMIQKLYLSDAEKGKALSAEMMQKMLDTDLTQKQNERMAVYSVINSMYKLPASTTKADEKSLRLDDKQLRDLSVKLADTYIKLNVEPVMMALNLEISRAMPIFEKLTPEKLPLIKQKQAAMSKSMPPAMRNSVSALPMITNPNTTADELIGEAGRVPVEQRSQYYNAAVSRIARVEDESSARNLIDQIPDEKMRARASENYESARIGRLAAQGKLEDAQKLIANITGKQTKLDRLASLAIDFNKKNTDKDRETAVKLMDQARGMITEMPENMSDMENLMRVVRGYSEVDIDRAFRMMDPVMSEIDDQTQAAATLSKYDRNSRAFKKGELVMNMSGDSIVSRLQNTFRILAKADLDKTIEMADKLHRQDARLAVYMYALQVALVKEKPAGPPNAPVIQ